MKNRYRVIIEGKKIYKEIEIAPEDTNIRFGTESDCDIRIRKDLFHNSWCLIFLKDENDIWNVTCSESLYISIDDVRKLMKLELNHGDKIVIKYQDSASEAFRLTFLIDFDYEEKDYDRRFDISS